MTGTIHAAESNAAGPSEICGPKAVWNLPRDAFSSCLDKNDGQDCLLRVMQETHASPEALDCTKRLDNEAYVKSSRHAGKLRLTLMAYPLRANTNEVLFITGGTPPLVSSELDVRIDISSDPLYPALLKKFPQLELWNSEASFRELEQGPDKGQNFLFAYPLLNGCHACELAGYALIALKFDQTGAYQGPKFIRLEAAE